MKKQILLILFTIVLTALTLTSCSDDKSNPIAVLPSSIELSTTEHDFGVIEAGDELTWSLTVFNRGDALLVLDSITISNPAFSVEYSADDMEIGAGLNRLLGVTFAPDTVGEYYGVLKVYSNDAESPEVPVELWGVVERAEVSLPEPWLLAANYSDGAGNLSLMNLSTMNVTNAAAGLGNNPNDIAKSGNFIYVVNTVSNDMNVVEIMDDLSLVSHDAVDLGIEVNTSPEFVAVDDDGLLYITNFNTNNVSVYDPHAGEIVAEIPVGITPMDIEIFDGKAFVCNSAFNFDDFSYGQGTVSVIDLASRTSTEFNTSTNPQYIDVDDNGMLHVVCTGNYGDVEGTILKVNPNSLEIVSTIPIGGKPAQIAFGAGDIAYVCAFGEWGEDNPGLVFRYNILDGTVLNDVSNPIEVGNGAARIVAASDGSVYISCYGADRVDHLVGDVLVSSHPIGDGPTPLLFIDID